MSLFEAAKTIESSRYFVVCCASIKPDLEWQLATSRAFENRQVAEKYAATVTPSLKPRVVCVSA